MSGGDRCSARGHAVAADQSVGAARYLVPGRRRRLGLAARLGVELRLAPQHQVEILRQTQRRLGTLDRLSAPRGDASRRAAAAARSASDHVNGQSLDNRKANLRWLTRSENAAHKLAREQVPSLAAIAADLRASLPARGELIIPF